MSRTAKIVLIIVGSLAVLAISAGVLVWRFVANNFTTDPTEASAIGQEITPHELPPGYDGDFGTDLFGFKMMLAMDQFGSESLIMLMSIPDGGTEADLRSASNDQFTDQTGMTVDFEYVDTRLVTIAGDEVELDRYEGEDQGVTVVQEIAVFESLDGRAALLMMFADKDLYAETGFDQFLKSLE